jgi:hypothetical protein
MRSEFKLATNLNKDEIDQIYSIHRKVYFDKGFGLTRNIWQMNLDRKYHLNHDKMVQIFYSEEDKQRIDGYNIFLKPIQINCYYWSKILEGGVTTVDKSQNNRTFLSMYNDLINWDIKTSYIGETSISSNGVTSLLIKSGFSLAEDKKLFEHALKEFLNSVNYSITNSDGKCVVHRITAINNNYEGYIMVFKSKIESNEYN